MDEEGWGLSESHKPPRPQLSAACIPGLEPLVAGELQRRLPGASVLATAFGYVRFTYPGPPADSLTLRTTEDVFTHIACLVDVPADASGLGVIEAALAACDLSPALKVLGAMRELPASPRFRVTATREGAHEFRSPQVAARAGSGIIAQTGWGVDLTAPDVDIWVQVRDDRATAGLRLSDESMSRRSRVMHGPASLRPTVAHAMCLLAEAQPGEVLLDPMCGTGTILLEATPLALTLVGSDTYVPSLAAAAANFSAVGLPGLLIQADARELPLRDASVDRIVCNLPWGIRVGSHRYNRQLYPAFLAEAHRLLRPGRRMVLLSQEKRLLEGALARWPDFGVRQTFTVHLGGLAPSIYVVERT